MRRLVQAAGVCIAIIFSHGAEQAFGESVSFAGVYLPVDSIKQIDQDHVAVDVAGQSFVSTMPNLGRSVAQVYVQRPELGRKLPWTRFCRMVADAVTTPNNDIAAMAISKVLTSNAVVEREVVEFFQTVASSLEGEAAILRQLRKQNSQEDFRAVFGCIAGRSLNPKNRKRAFNSVSAPSNWAATECTPYFINAAYQAMAELNISEITEILGVLSEDFSSDDPEVQRAKRLLVLIEAAIRSENSDNMEACQAAVVAVKADLSTEKLYRRIFPMLVAHLAVRAIAFNRPSAALRLLAQLDFDSRTDMHHTLVAGALNDLGVKDVAILEIKEVWSAVALYAEKDERIREAILDLLTRIVGQRVAAGKSREGMTFIRKILDLRPDPFEDNDAVRREVVLGLLREGETQLGQAVLKDMRTPVPLLFWLRFYLERPVTWPLFIVGLVACFCATNIIRRERRHGKARNVNQRSAAISDETRAEIEEYIGCLALFNLEQGAKERHIKAAYRNAVKECHPDIRSQSQGQQTDRFIEMTKAYERLLELHKKFGA